MHEFAVEDIWEWHKDPNLKLVQINVEKAKYFGRPWKELRAYEKRKFENVLFLGMHDDKHRTKILYHDQKRGSLSETY